MRAGAIAAIVVGVLGTAMTDWRLYRAVMLGTGLGGLGQSIWTIGPNIAVGCGLFALGAGIAGLQRSTIADTHAQQDRAD